MKHKYEEQWERVQRWYQRFKDINDGKPHIRNTEYEVDDVYAFFIDCYHLKDWIKHDNTLKIKNKGKCVEKYVHNTKDCLNDCGLICNSLKHLNPGKPEFIGKKYDVTISEFIGGDTKEMYEQNPTIIKMKFNIDTSDGVKDAFDFATECMESWKRFITEVIKEPTFKK
jgi:hypothetical protein